MIPPDLSDVELIDRVARRDSTALENLYDRYAASALGLALKILGDRQVAEEIVQETFWRIWKSATTFNLRRGTFSAWLFGIVRNLAVDELRRRSSQPRSIEPNHDDSALDKLASDGDELEHQVWTNSRHQQVRAAMNQLPPAQRRVIELAYFQGMTRQEIATQLGEPPGTIHTRARLGLQKLRSLLNVQELRDG